MSTLGVNLAMSETVINIQNIIQEYIVQELMYEQPETNLTVDTPLIEAEILDSMAIFRLISFIEERFEFTLNHEDVVLESFETIAAIATLVESHLA